MPSQADEPLSSSGVSNDQIEWDRNDFAALVGIAVVGFAAFARLIFAGQDFYWGDIELYFAPMQAFLRSSLAGGIVPLWNPHIFCGEPFAGDPQTFLLYPPAALLRLATASPWRFVTLDSALHLILGGLFFYPFARSEGLTRGASALAAIAFMLGGYCVSKAQFPNMAQSIAYVPAVLWACGKLAQRPGVNSSVLLGAAIGLQLLAGHAQISVLTLYLALPYALLKYRLQPLPQRQRRAWLRPLLWGVCSVVLAGALSMAQLLPILDNLRSIAHPRLSLLVANRFTLALDQLGNCVLPNLYGSPIAGDYAASGNYWETCIYCGPLVATFAAIGLLKRTARTHASALFWGAVVFFAVWLSFGVVSGLYTAAYALLPGIRSFHDPARFLLWAVIAGSVLAGFGFDRLLDICPQRARALVTCGALVAVSVQLGLFDNSIYPTLPDSSLDAAIHAAALANAPISAGRVISDPDTRKFWRYFISYGDYHQRDPAYLSHLFATLTPNTGMLLGVDDAGGYDPEPPRGAPERSAEAFNSVIDPATGALRAAGANLSAPSGMDIRRIIWYSANPGEMALDGYDPAKLRMWDNPEAARISRARILQTGACLSVHDCTPDWIEIVVPAHLTPATLRVADTAMDGWQAQIGHRTLAITRSSDGFRIVTLPPSAYSATLDMRYEPASWEIGLYLSLLAWSLVLGFVIYAVLSGKGLRACNGWRDDRLKS